MSAGFLDIHKRSVYFFWLLNLICFQVYFLSQSEFHKPLAYVLVWEPVSKQKRLLGLSQNGALYLGTFFFYKDTFIYHINLEELKKQNFVAFFVCF